MRPLRVAPPLRLSVRLNRLHGVRRRTTEAEVSARAYTLYTLAAGNTKLLKQKGVRTHPGTAEQTKPPKSITKRS